MLHPLAGNIVILLYFTAGGWLGKSTVWVKRPRGWANSPVIE
jgi:hypothetical protein